MGPHDPPQHSNIWTHGSRDIVPRTKIEVAGAGTLVQQADVVFDNHHQGHLQDIGTEKDSKAGSGESSLLFRLCILLTLVLMTKMSFHVEKDS